MAWEAAIDPGDPFSRAGLAAHWRLATRDLVVTGYGQWLAFLEQRDELNAHVKPAKRLTRESVEAYVMAMRSNLRSATVTIRVDCLVKAISVMAPQADIAWLRRILQHLKRQMRDRKPKINRIRPSRELYRLGLKLMKRVQTAPSLTKRMAAIQYRDGLMIAFLAARPLRLSTFARLELGRHVALRGHTFWLDIPGDLTKTGEPIEMPLPIELNSYLARYITVYRPLLLGQRSTERLWISEDGLPYQRASISDRIRWRTKQEFGVSITPQLFRDCAATSIAVQDPDHVHVAAVLLGHKTLQTTERYYNQARLLDAGRHYHAQICRLRGPLRRS
jgi:site-specific recombinase XerD